MRMHCTQRYEASINSPTSGCSEERSAYQASALLAGGFSRRGARKRVPSLDPEPQVLQATIEARFSASGADLGERIA